MIADRETLSKCYTHGMNSSQKISILLITGTVGVGKTSVADEVYEILKHKNDPVALINIDELGYAVPHPDDDRFNIRLQLKNLSAIWPNYSELGVESLIVPCVIENKGDVEHFRNMLPSSDIFVVRLTASLSTVEDRIKGRLMGGSLDWHLKRAQELEEIFEHQSFEDVLISNEAKMITEVANEVIAAWSSPPQSLHT